jgi:hypothetical protein
MCQPEPGVSVAQWVMPNDDPRFSPTHTDPSAGWYATVSVVPLPMKSPVANCQSCPGATVAHLSSNQNAEPVFAPTHTEPLSR